MLAELLIAPLLVGGSTVACRRWGERVGGLLSAFPAVVGPVLLILAQERGAVFTARAANGTLLGLVALAGFIVGYSRTALQSRWELSLVAGWACAGAIAASVPLWGQNLAVPGRLAAAAISLAIAYRVMPEAPSSTFRTEPTPARRGIRLRMAATAALVLALAGAAELLGPLIGGVLTALPVLASALAVFTHRDQGGRAVVALLRGMLTGMTGFVGFCAVVAVLLVPLGIAVAFAAATAAAVAFQAAAIFAPHADAASNPSASRT